MFDRNQKYNLSKAQLEEGILNKNSELDESTFSNFNSYVNFGFSRSNENEKNVPKNVIHLDVNDNVQVNVPRRKSLISKLTNDAHHANFQRGETLFSFRKSITPQLETLVKWDNLELEVGIGNKTKKILDNISGEVNNLEIMAILGPSGAGKSTLLNAIAGKIKSYTGSVKFYSNDKRISFSYVPQQDQLYDYLTVKESLLFASKAKNSSDTNHLEEVEFVLSAFNLWKAKNHYAMNCSGGERKRLSIGLEMISKPKILILDEPTSGLDSTTSYKVIEVLKNINKNTVIITTIHQPNSKLFQLFDKCYFLTSGKCIYSGLPSNIVDYFSKFNAVCPNFTNPADFVLDVANDIKTEQGQSLIDRLHSYRIEKIKSDNLKNDNSDEFPKRIAFDDQKNDNTTFKVFTDPINSNKVTLIEISRSSLKKKKSFFTGFSLNTKRLYVCFFRDPLQTIFRLLNCLVFPIILRFTVTGQHGLETGCQFLRQNDTHISEENMFEKFDRQLIGVQNAGLTFIDLMFLFFSALVPAVLVLSNKINVLKKEYLNSYYSISSFYFSVMIVNLTMGFIYSMFNAFSYFFFTGQRYTQYKLFLFWVVLYLSTILGDLFGLGLSIIFTQDELTAVVFGSFLCFSLYTLSGFFIPINSMTQGVKALSYLTHCRHTFEATIRIFYGDNGCEIKENMLFNYDTLIEFTKYYNHETNNSLQEIEDSPLKVKNALRDKLWNKTEMFDFAVLMNDLDDEGVEKLNTFWKEKTSYIFEYFGIYDTSLQENFIVILIIIITLKVLCFLGLKYKFKKYY